MIDTQKIWEFHLQGMSIREIARLMDTSKSSVNFHIQALKKGREIKPIFNQERIDAIRTLALEGKSVRQIASILKMSKSGVHYYYQYFADDIYDITRGDKIYGRYT